eukprot:6187828-Pleurochrysis_carterae.AAC.2
MIYTRLNVQNLVFHGACAEVHRCTISMYYECVGSMMFEFDAAATQEHAAVHKIIAHCIELDNCSVKLLLENCQRPGNHALM